MVLKELLTVDREWESLTSVSRRVILICTLLLVFMVVGVSSAANVGDVVSNSIGMKLVWIPPGEFMMGSDNGAPNEKPVHRVKISKGFWMGQTEVTQDQYRAVTGDSPSAWGWKKDNLPVENIAWEKTIEFCKKLSQKEGLTYTLPTEAQWEYACRAGTKTAFSFGDSASELENYGWYRDNATHTLPVGQKKPNAFGLYDMHGNVLEWCSDWHDNDYYKNSPEVDPTGPSSGGYRVVRSGCFVGHARSCQSSFRGRLEPDYRFYNQGFRVVLLADGCGDIIEEACKTADEGFKPIFNSKDLSEWEGDKRFWSIQNGEIIGQITSDLNEMTYLFWRGGDVEDFDLRLSFRIEGEYANSGFQFRSQKRNDGHAVGYQADIGESTGGSWTGFLYEANGRGPLAKRGQKVVIDEDGSMQVTSIGDAAELLKKVKPSDWNDYQIIARGNELTLKINGVLMSQGIDKQKGKAAGSGTFAIQLHNGPPMKVQFKNIWLKKLTD